MTEKPTAEQGSNAEQQFAVVLRVRDVLQLLPCGKGWLLAHLRACPVFRGRPTHRFAGRTIIFTAQDFETLLESFPVRMSAGGPRRPDIQDSAPTLPVEVAKRPKIIGRRGKRDYLKPPKVKPSSAD